MRKTTLGGRTIRHVRTAYQAGCDARYTGKPISPCPYTSADALDWVSGWRAVDAALKRQAHALQEGVYGVARQS